MQNKFVVSIIIPTKDLCLDISIPNNKKVGTIKESVISLIEEIIGEKIELNNDELRFVDKASGMEYENNMCIKDTGIKNGSKIILI